MHYNSQLSFPYHYSGFGSAIASHIELPGLNPLEPIGQGFPDIIVSLGPVDREPINVTYSRKYMKMGVGFYWLSVPDAGLFYVEQNGAITVEVIPGANPRVVRSWLYSLCIPAALFFAGKIPLHGSSINMNEHGLWLTGKSGAGKSTLASFFLKKGHPFIADDLTVVTFQSNQPIIHHSTPIQKLCPDAIKRLGWEKSSDFVFRGMGNRIKYPVDVPHRSLEPIILNDAVELVPSLAKTPSMREVCGAEKMQMLLQNTYRGFMLKGLQLKPWHFQACSILAHTVRCYKLERPKKGYWEQELYDLIIEKLETNSHMY